MFKYLLFVFLFSGRIDEDYMDELKINPPLVVCVATYSVSMLCPDYLSELKLDRYLGDG